MTKNERRESCPICDQQVGGDQPGPWPELCLGSVPGEDATVSLAARVRRAVFGARNPLTTPLDLDELCRLGGFRVRERRLGGARGGLEGVLAPARGDRFEIHVDPEPPGGWSRIPAAVRQSLRRQRLRFRVAHEVAHSFFYDRDGDVPRRRLGDSLRQEEFCDRFAAELLLPGVAVASTAQTARAVFELSTQFDVSLQLAARSFAGHWQQATVALFVGRLGRYECQWKAGELPSGWVDETLELEHFDDSPASFRMPAAWDMEHLDALTLPERQQMLVVGGFGA